jgi:hypothetical protein
MAITFHNKITFRPGSMFCFGTISSIEDEEGTLHRIADPPRKKSPPTNSEDTGEVQPPALRRKIATTAAPFYPDVLFIGRVESPPRLRRRANRVWGRTTSAGVPSTKKSVPKHPATSPSRRTGSGAACLARRDLGDGRNSGRTRLQRTKELPTT